MYGSCQLSLSGQTPLSAIRGGLILVEPHLPHWALFSSLDVSSSRLEKGVQWHIRMTCGTDSIPVFFEHFFFIKSQDPRLLASDLSLWECCFNSLPDFRIWDHLQPEKLLWKCAVTGQMFCLSAVEPRWVKYNYLQPPYFSSLPKRAG